MSDLCLFCLKSPGDSTPWCKEAPGKGCTYGLDHEREQPPVQKQQEKKADKNRCTKCGLHPKNPVSVTNGCAHEYAT